LSKLLSLCIALSWGIVPAAAPGASGLAADGRICGTDPAGVLTDLFRHRQSQARRARLAAQGVVLDQPGPAYLPDIGNIAIMDDSEGVVVRPNPFDLQQLTLGFSPSGAAAAQYTAAARPIAFDNTGSTAGTPLAGMGDDDARLVRLPFAFPFYGRRYDSVYVNSDGNLSFTAGDNASTPRSLGRAISGPPRIFPFFADLDPSRPDAAIRYFAGSDRAVFTWDQVPLYAESGIGLRQSFQAVLYADGRIDFHYQSITANEAVVGIAPGSLLNGSTPADFDMGVAAPAAGALAEVFSPTTQMDPVAISQKFYRNHEDAYDYVVVFNNLGLTESAGAFASERNVRNQVRGIGGILRDNPIFDLGADFGSPVRLQSFLTMGPLSNYPPNPGDVIPIFSSSGNTPLTILGQESGHRFLAYVRFLDPATNQPSTDLLGRALAHWSFFFNSDASVVEGNRIRDNGESQSPRFATTATVEHYSALDQYLMGLRAAEETPATFLVRNPSIGIPASSPPQAGVSFNGSRLDITVPMIAAVEGRRIPDSTVAQKHFNYAFVLLVKAGTQPSAAEIAQLDNLRAAWEQFFASAVDNRATAGTKLVRQLRLSTWPAGGVLTGSAAPAAVTIAAPLSTRLDVALSSGSAIAVPAMVTIPAGGVSASFTITGNSAGVAELTARASDASFESSQTFVQVRSDAAQLSLAAVSGDRQQGGRGGMLAQPVVFQVRDGNNVPFAGVNVSFSASGDGAAIPARAATDAAGRVSVNWRLASTGTGNTLRAALDGAPSVTAAATASGLASAVFSAAGVVNAASFNTGAAAGNIAIAPGSLITIFGTSLAAATVAASGFPLPVSLGSTSVSINGIAAPLLYVSPGQINLQVPFEIAGPAATLVVSTSAGPSAPVSLPVAAAQPGIFFDAASGLGAILQNSDGRRTDEHPAGAGDFLQIYATGLGAVAPAAISGFAAPSAPLAATVAQPAVTIAGLPAPVAFSGLAPGFAGLYQLTVRVPGGVPSGRQSVALTVNGLRSNEVFIVVR
jgi:uncharacterized protein (TIGR03437 family)